MYVTDEWVFRLACRNGHPETARFLAQRCSSLRFPRARLSLRPSRLVASALLVLTLRRVFHAVGFLQDMSRSGRRRHHLRFLGL